MAFTLGTANTTRSGDLMTSQNVDAARVMGRRRTGVVPFDQPAELGYRCPKCPPYAVEVDGYLDERLTWSEYEGFLWCRMCDFDYPSVLCIDLAAEPDPERTWLRRGRVAAVQTFLATVSDALRRAEVSRVGGVARWQAAKTADVLKTESAGWPEWSVVSIDDVAAGPLVTCPDQGTAERVAEAMCEYDGRMECPYIRGGRTTHCALADRDAELVERARELIGCMDPYEVGAELVDLFGPPAGSDAS